MLKLLSYRIIYYTIALGIIFFAALMGGLFFLINHTYIDVAVLQRYNTVKPSLLLDDEGKEWARFTLDRRDPVPLSAMPSHLINAFIAAEDHNFFSHYGISVRGIIRSLLVNVYHRKIVQGASTITQQLIKLLFFDAQKTFQRKVKEQFFALMIEQQYTKEQILQLYLNHVYFGCGIYGVQTASQRFWGKDVSELSLEQAATLAGIVRSPGRYCPLLYPQSAQQRRNVVLRSMMQLGFINQPEYQQARATELTIASSESQQLAPHFKEALRMYLEKNYGRQLLYNGGLLIQTTLNRSMQQKAEECFVGQVKKLRTKIHPAIDGGLATLDVPTGGVKALVGGFDFSISKFNRALQAHRQMGSIFKTVIYTAALECGYSFSRTDNDEPLSIMHNNKAWEPHNYDHSFEGSMTLARALSQSNNIIAIKTLLSIGYAPVQDVARRFHIESPILAYPSMALGCMDCCVLEVAGMFNIFAHNGIYVKPHLISWIKDEWGKKIFHHQNEPERVMSSRVCSQLNKVLRASMDRARKRKKEEWIDSQAIGKTGTTNDCRTCWFAGSTPDFTTAIYLGCDNNESLGDQIYGASTAFPIWFSLYRSLPLPHKKFYYDPLLQEIVIDGKTGRLSHDPRNPNAIAILV